MHIYNPQIMQRTRLCRPCHLCHTSASACSRASASDYAALPACMYTWDTHSRGSKHDSTCIIDTQVTTPCCTLFRAEEGLLFFFFVVVLVFVFVVVLLLLLLIFLVVVVVLVLVRLPQPR
mmetsp:Transcript_894/g.2451  ORF Transcript_894/g.2451 Transcript_894/m.2451 type:complete len:120 (-) Transcript_894:1672-2031(-)